MVRMVRMVIPDTFGCYQSEWFVSSTCGSPPSWMGLFIIKNIFNYCYSLIEKIKLISECDFDLKQNKKIR